MNYLKLLLHGFEEPKYVSDVINETPTHVSTENAHFNRALEELNKDYLNHHKLESVEYRKYDTDYETSKYIVPSHFVLNENNNAPPQTHVLPPSPPQNQLQDLMLSDFLELKENSLYLSQENIDNWKPKIINFT